MGATSGFCGKSREFLREEVGENPDGPAIDEAGPIAPEFDEAECKMDGLRPADGKVVMVLQVEERRAVGGSSGSAG